MNPEANFTSLDELMQPRAEGVDPPSVDWRAFPMRGGAQHRRGNHRPSDHTGGESCGGSGVPADAAPAATLFVPGKLKATAGDVCKQVMQDEFERERGVDGVAACANTSA